MSAYTMTGMPTAETAVPTRWTSVCGVDRIVPDTGVTALVNGVQVAVFRLSDDRVYAIGNHDPCSKANVLSRGIVGDVEGRPFVASPIHKQRFDLASGSCLDVPDAMTAAFDVRIAGGVIQVATE
jgi:nitrite reductase (NADH) small subunit